MSFWDFLRFSDFLTIFDNFWIFFLQIFWTFLDIFWIFFWIFGFLDFFRFLNILKICESFWIFFGFLQFFGIPFKVTYVTTKSYQGQKQHNKTVFRCLSPFNISLEQSVWADFSWNPFQKRITLICFGPNHFGKKFWGKIWIFSQVIFNFYAEIGFFGLTWRVTLL